MSTPSRFELARWQANFAANTERLEKLPGRGDHSGLKRVGWSAAQCIGHLSITADAYLPVWRQVNDSELTKPGGRYAFWWCWFLGGMRDPKKMRVKTPEPFEPKADLELGVALEGYRGRRSEVYALALRMHELQKGGIAVASPFASWMKYPNDFSYDLWLAHEDRHLAQAESI